MLSEYNYVKIGVVIPTKTHVNPNAYSDNKQKYGFKIVYKLDI